MSAASPPPPPDPTRNNPFSSPSCGSSPSRPALRRAKTLANPESPTTWRREPLVDVTNQVLGREYGQAHGRLQRVPLDDDLSPLALTGPSLDSRPPSPTPSRIPRRSLALRRTRSAMPSMGGSSPSSANPAPAPPAIPADGLDIVSPTRELRPRPRPAVAAGTAIPAPPPLPDLGSRRTRSASGGGGSSAPVPTATPSRRRTFGGVGLAAVLEDPVSEDASVSAAPTPTPTPRTRSRARRLEDDADEAASSSENERRLRRRRTTGSTPGTPSGRMGLR
ncbi:hypothetical protein JCM10213v2_002592 [Rhodosporidiobolus nylandii]